MATLLANLGFKVYMVEELSSGRKNGKFVDVIISTDKRNNTVYISVFPVDKSNKEN